jgi:hypothetical protein
VRRSRNGVINRGLQRRYRVSRTMMLCGQAKDEGEEDEANGPLLLRGQNKNLAANSFPSGPLHVGRVLTCRARYLPAMSRKLATSVLGEHRCMGIS